MNLLQDHYCLSPQGVHIVQNRTKVRPSVRCIPLKCDTARMRYGEARTELREDTERLKLQMD